MQAENRSHEQKFALGIWDSNLLVNQKIKYIDIFIKIGFAELKRNR